MAVAARTIELANGSDQVVYVGGSGPPVVWLHGLSGVEADDPVLSSLLDRHEVYAPLAPGFNDLAELEEIEDIHELALHYDDVLERLGLNGVPVVGYSFGAMMAAELASHVPARASALVLISPLGLWDDDNPVTDFFAVPYPQMPSLLYANGVGRNASAKPDEAPDVEGLVAIAQGMTSLAKFLWPIPDRRLYRRAHRIGAPTLVIMGKQDRIVPVEYAARFEALIPDAQSLTVDGAGHAAHWDEPTLVVDAINDFIIANTARTT